MAAYCTIFLFAARKGRVLTDEARVASLKGGQKAKAESIDVLPAFGFYVLMFTPPLASLHPSPHRGGELI